MEQPGYLVMLFASVNYALRAEKFLKEAGIPHKLIPVPRHISSDCGVCLRFLPEHRQTIEQILGERVIFDGIQEL